MKNKNKIFFVLALLTLLIAVSTVNAVDNTTVADDTTAINDASSDTISAETVQTSTNEQSVATKTIEKEEKQIKTTTKTVEVTDGDSLSNAITQASTDTENDEYIINLNEGTYELSKSINVKDISTITINGNGQRISSTRSITNRIASLTLKDVELYFAWSIINRGENLTLINSSVINRGDPDTGDSKIVLGSGNFIVDENSYIDPTVALNLQGGNIISNNVAFNERLVELGIYLGENTIENQTITTAITNGGNLTLRNCILNSQITNGGTLTLCNCTVNSQITNNKQLIIDDDTTFQANTVISNGNGEINITDINKIVPYIDRINGTYTISNLTLNKPIRLSGDILVENCIIERQITTGGIVTFKNCTVNVTNGGTWLYTTGIVIINDDTEIISGTIDDSQSIGIIYGERPESFNPTTFDEDQTIENMTFTLKSTNNANIQIINSDITAPIINQGNLTFENCNILSQITNNANMTFINCSFSNNDITVISTKIDGFLLNNCGNATLIGCLMENNSFNTTAIEGMTGHVSIINGAIFNNATLNVYNSSFCNNSVGYFFKDQIWMTEGSGACIYNNGS